MILMMVGWPHSIDPMVWPWHIWVTSHLSSSNIANLLGFIRSNPHGWWTRLKKMEPLKSYDFRIIFAIQIAITRGHPFGIRSFEHQGVRVITCSWDWLYNGFMQSINLKNVFVWWTQPLIMSIKENRHLRKSVARCSRRWRSWCWRNAWVGWNPILIYIGFHGRLVSGLFLCHVDGNMDCD
jgi:hypothetical protein